MNNSSPPYIHNCQLDQPPRFSRRTVVVVVEAVAVLPCDSNCVPASAKAVLRSVRDSVSAHQDTLRSMRTLISLDRRDKGDQARWHRAVLASSAGLRSTQASLGERVWLDAIAENSCFGHRVLRKALGLEVDEKGVFNVSGMFRNTLAYVWSLSRASSIGDVALHLDSDWRVQATPSPPTWAPRYSWLTFALTMLQHTPNVSAICLEFPPFTHVHPRDKSSLRARYGEVSCSATCSDCSYARTFMRHNYRPKNPWRFQGIQLMSGPLQLAACGYTRPPWLAMSPQQRAMLSTQAYVVHLPRFINVAWPFPNPRRFSEMLFAEHTAREGAPLPVFLSGNALGVTKCATTRDVPVPLRPEAICSALGSASR